jgi:hypothetical protein
MDINGDQFVVNGQRLKVYYEPDVVPFTMLMSSPWRKSPNVPPRTKNKASTFVNSFSFSFLEFSRRFTGPTFSHGLRKKK